eukprot:11277598-Karenia_brevis.AAC.1
MGKKKSHTRTSSREAERETRRQEVGLESLCRTCSRPPWEEHNEATCIAWLEVCRHRACLKRVAERKALDEWARIRHQNQGGVSSSTTQEERERALRQQALHLSQKPST